MQWVCMGFAERNGGYGTLCTSPGPVCGRGKAWALGRIQAPFQAPGVGCGPLCPFSQLGLPCCLWVAPSPLSSRASPLQQGLGHPALTSCGIRGHQPPAAPAGHRGPFPPARGALLTSRSRVCWQGHIQKEAAIWSPGRSTVAPSPHRWGPSPGSVPPSGSRGSRARPPAPPTARASRPGRQVGCPGDWVPRAPRARETESWRPKEQLGACRPDQSRGLRNEAGAPRTPCSCPSAASPTTA